jgi:hypothetical protein
MCEEGSRNQAFLSEEAHCRGPLGRAPLLGTLEDMLRKAPDMGISLLRGPFRLRGTWNQEGGSYTGDFE